MERKILVDYIPFKVSPQQINESMSLNGGRVIVEGVLQRSGAKNQNGRIYPKEILAREVANYKKIQIAEKRALGELICWDFVSNPSTHGAFMKPIQSEGVLTESAIKQNQSYVKVNTIIRDILCEMEGCCPVD